MPDGIDGRSHLLEILQHLAARLAELQHESGDWHTILDYPESSLEPSIAAFVIAGFMKAREAGLLERNYEPQLLLAQQAFRNNLQKGGQFPVSEATAVGDFDYYHNLGFGVFPWGQGPALMAACRMERS